MLREFKEFIARANIIDLAVAVIIGVAFGKIVTSLVDGIIMPPIRMLLGKVDFASLFLVLDASKGVPVLLADAKVKGVPVIAYGAFINDIVNFAIVAGDLPAGQDCEQAQKNGSLQEGLPLLPDRNSDQGDSLLGVLR